MTIMWSEPLPFCQSCHKSQMTQKTGGFCTHALSAIVYREDTPVNWSPSRSVAVPISFQSFFDFKKVASVRVGVVPRDNHALLRWEPWPSDFGVILPGMPLHRMDIGAMLVPLLVEWELGHPCPNCGSSKDKLENYQMAIRAAYRLSLSEPEWECWQCHSSDLVPDVPSYTSGGRRAPKHAKP